MYTIYASFSCFLSSSELLLNGAFSAWVCWKVILVGTPGYGGGVAFLFFLLCIIDEQGTK